MRAVHYLENGPGDATLAEVSRREVDCHVCRIAFPRGDRIALEAFNEASPLEPDRAPRAHGTNGGAPAGHPSQQRGAEPSKLLLLHHARAPAWPRPALAHRGTEGAEPDAEFVRGAEKCGGTNFHLAEHVGARRHRFTVDPDVGQCGESLEPQHGRFAVVQRLRVELATVPPVTCIVIFHAIQLGQDTVGALRGSHSARHQRRNPHCSFRQQFLGRACAPGRKPRHAPTVRQRLAKVGRNSHDVRAPGETGARRLRPHSGARAPPSPLPSSIPGGRRGGTASHPFRSSRSAPAGTAASSPSMRSRR